MGSPRPFLTVEEARPLPGLRVAFTQGVPGPWGQAIREVLDLKGIEYTAVVQEGGGENAALREWTGQTSAPVAIYEDERPRSQWSEMLLLAERLAPEPRLIPEDEAERMTMFGMLHELCAEDGYGWSNRLLVLDLLDQVGAHEITGRLRAKFSSGAAIEHAVARVRAITQGLADVLERQKAAGSGYFVGQRLTAADIYWTTFSNMLEPIREEWCPMTETYRSWTIACRECTVGTVPAILIEHRDRILETHLDPPMWF